MRFSGKRVIITGAASGIGRATAILFAAEGASITIGDINEAGLAETAAMMVSQPRIVAYDASDYASCRALVEAGAEDGLDILCNVSGMLKWGPSLDFSMEDFDRIIRVNTSSIFAMCQAALPHLIKSKGNIVNTAPGAGLHCGIRRLKARRGCDH
jgi:meso-butanediol dehydrogenase / (S,S)-butanediol dehydrogenase / diacetyl reductase